MILHLVFRSNRKNYRSLTKAESFEPIDETLSMVASLVRLTIEPIPSAALTFIGQDSGPDQSAQGGRPLVQHR
jgi:hypothetical protein